MQKFTTVGVQVWLRATRCDISRSVTVLHPGHDDDDYHSGIWNNVHVCRRAAGYLLLGNHHILVFLDTGLLGNFKCMHQKSLGLSEMNGWLPKRVTCHWRGDKREWLEVGIGTRYWIQIYLACFELTFFYIPKEVTGPSFECNNSIFKTGLRSLGSVKESIERWVFIQR